jgi:hypothetical protein
MNPGTRQGLTVAEMSVGRQRRKAALVGTSFHATDLVNM